MKEISYIIRKYVKIFTFVFRLDVYDAFNNTRTSFNDSKTQLQQTSEFIQVKRGY